MNDPEKLKLVQTLSGLTQEKLARELGVSFATVNSWLAGRSVPRAAARRRIDDLCVRWGGAAEANDDPCSFKKRLLLGKRKSGGDVLDRLTGRKDLRDQFLLSLTYNTNRIEGSTLSERDTAAILFENAALPNKSLVEHLEAKNHQAALEFLFRALSEGGKPDEALVLKLHAILMNGIQPDAGLYRRHGVRIVGAHVPTANFVKVPELMARLMEEVSAPSPDVLSHVARVHARFEQIHPFSDGNGRVGRLLMAAMLLREGFPPAVIEQKKRRPYLAALNRAQLKEDFADLEERVAEGIVEGYRLLES